jgi:hypothetical protein
VTTSTEHELAGINVTTSTLDEARHALGEPARRATHDLLGSDLRGAFTLAHVEWNLGDVALAVITRVAVDHECPEEVVAVRVIGRGLGHQTGAGLKTGDSVEEAVACYGPPQSADPLWFRFSDGGRLMALVRSGRIFAIHLWSPWLAGRHPV